MNKSDGSDNHLKSMAIKNKNKAKKKQPSPAKTPHRSKTLSSNYLCYAIPSAVLIWYGLFKAGFLGMYSSTAFSVLIGAVVILSMMSGVLRTPNRIMGGVLPLLMILAMRFPPIDGVLFICGWLIAWNGHNRSWGPSLFLGVTFLCYAGLIANLIGGDDWPLGNLNYLALASGVVWSVYLGRQLIKSKTAAIHHLIGMTMVMVILVLVKHRGQSVLVLMVLGSTALLYSLKQPWKAIFLGGGILVFVWAGWSGLLKEALYSSGKIGSVYDRWLHYGVAWKGFLKAPVWGEGVWGYSLAQSGDAFFRITSWARMDADPANAHNIFLQVLVCSGTVGLLTLVSVTGWLIWRTIHNQKEKAIPFIFALLAFTAAGGVSKAPFSAPGIVIWGAVWGSMAAFITKPIENKGAAHGQNIVWPGFLFRENPKSVAPKILRWIVVLALLLFTVVQPINHERVIRTPYLALRQPFDWLFYAPRVFFPSTAHISDVLFKHKRYQMLYEFEKWVNARVPRKIGWMRLAYAASLAGRPAREVCRAAVNQFLWNPFEMNPKESAALRQIMLKGGVKTLERYLATLSPSKYRAVACFSGIDIPQAEAVRKMLSTDTQLSIMNMAWALHGSYYLKKKDPSLFKEVVNRCLEELEKKGKVTFFLARHLRNHQ